MDQLTKDMVEFNELEFKFAKWRQEIYDELNETHNSEKFREDICDFQEARYSAFMLFFMKKAETAELADHFCCSQGICNA